MKNNIQLHMSTATTSAATTSTTRLLLGLVVQLMLTLVLLLLLLVLLLHLLLLLLPPLILVTTSTQTLLDADNDITIVLLILLTQQQFTVDTVSQSNGTLTQAGFVNCYSCWYSGAANNLSTNLSCEAPYISYDGGSCGGEACATYAYASEGNFHPYDFLSDIVSLSKSFMRLYYANLLCNFLLSRS